MNRKKKNEKDEEYHCREACGKGRQGYLRQRQQKKKTLGSDVCYRAQHLLYQLDLMCSQMKFLTPSTDSQKKE